MAGTWAAISAWSRPLWEYISQTPHLEGNRSELWLHRLPLTLFQLPPSLMWLPLGSNARPALPAEASERTPPPTPDLLFRDSLLTTQFSESQTGPCLQTPYDGASQTLLQLEPPGRLMNTEAGYCPQSLISLARGGAWALGDSKFRQV